MSGKANAIPGVDLSALDAFNLSELGTVTAPSAGKPLRIPLDEIEEDIDNARTKFNPATIRELAETIDKKGDPKEPISVRSRGPNGKYMLNSGARRLRACRLLQSEGRGKPDIPALIDDDWDEDDRFVVNVQRESVDPMDQASYLAKRLPKFNGNRSELAKRIGKSPAYVTQHLALLDLPPAIQKLYDEGVSRSATTLYELARLHKRDSAAVEEAVQGATEIGESMLKQLAAAIKGDGQEGATQQPEAPSSEKETSKSNKKAKAGATGDSDGLRVRIIVKHKGKRYELDGDFTTTAKAPTAGRFYIRKGSDKPMQVPVAELTLDQIIVK